MKLYSRMRKRLYKKVLRNYGRKDSGWQLEKLEWAMTLKKGDLIYTCAGSNEYIEEINPDYVHFLVHSYKKKSAYQEMKRGYYIPSFSFLVSNPYSGSAHGCDLFACGLGPPATREFILQDLHNDLDGYYDYEFWEKYHSREVMEKQEKEDRLYQALCVRHEEPFDEKGVCTLTQD